MNNDTDITSSSTDFIREIVARDISEGKNQGRVVTRFPPEPNGYLHIGHAKSICLNFGIARENPGGVCHLRFDDTNPAKEEEEYVRSITEDIDWLGFDPGEHIYYASDYFDRLYGYAEDLIGRGLAYVCDLTREEIRHYRGTLTEPGKESPFRERTAEENLELFRRMRMGEFADGTRVLRAKIDMASPNLNLRDPTIYRIRRETHHRTGDDWCIYPMYDFAHCLSDAIEKITHSICTLEFENNRPLYEWFIDHLEVPSQPRQIEFARLNISHTILSKRKLLELVEKKVVTGWDDPRMPTLAGLRRRGYTPESIRRFCDTIGVAKRDSNVDLALLEHCLRDDLNQRANRVMAVLKPLKVTIENYPAGKVEYLEAENNPEDPTAGTRQIPFSRVLYIEEDDFRLDPPKKFFRLGPGREVRLKHAYFIKCERVITDPETGKVIELRCTYDPATKSGTAADGRKVRGTLHWVSAPEAITAEVRLYDTLFTDPMPGSGQRPLEEEVNPASLKVISDARVEPGLAEAKPGDRLQFLRTGYFTPDPDSAPDRLIFNRVVPLRDTWAKIESKR